MTDLAKPYYETELGKLYHGDCLDVMKKIDTADVVITDPVWPNCPEKLLIGSEDPYGLFEQAFGNIIVKRLVIILRNDSDPRILKYINSNMSFFRLQLLPYVMPGYIGRKLGGDEIAYCFGDPIPSLPGQRVIPGRAPKCQPDGRRSNGHPCSRALKHIEWLVRWWSMPGEVILDPFMGSGTTAIASERLNRRWIGIEISKEYCDIAVDRIKKETAQLKLGI